MQGILGWCNKHLRTIQTTQTAPSEHSSPNQANMTLNQIIISTPRYCNNTGENVGREKFGWKKGGRKEKSLYPQNCVTENSNSKKEKKTLPGLAHSIYFRIFLPF